MIRRTSLPLVPRAASPGYRGTRWASFLTYIVVFHLAWVAWPYFVYPRLHAVGNLTFTYALLNLGIRSTAWIAPVLLYLRFVDHLDPFAYLKLNRRVARGIITALALTALNFAGMLARFGVPQLNAQAFTWNSVLSTSMLIGVIEEIPYRGFMLQKFSERMNFWSANIITSVLFVGIHLPGWIALHTLRADMAATIFIFSFVVGLAFRYSGSLWAPILTHSANDFLSAVVFRL